MRVTAGVVYRLPDRGIGRDRFWLAACFFVLEVASDALVAVRNHWPGLRGTDLDRACPAVHIRPLDGIRSV